MSNETVDVLTAAQSEAADVLAGFNGLFADKPEDERPIVEQVIVHFKHIYLKVDWRNAAPPSEKGFEGVAVNGGQRFYIPDDSYVRTQRIDSRDCGTKKG